MPTSPDPEAASRTGVTALIALVLTRACVSFQFQSLTPLVPALQQAFPLAPAEFGLLLGLYMAPGAVMAVAAPVLSRRIGRLRVLHLALVLMALGQAVLLMAGDVVVAAAGRLLAGLGGCMLYTESVDLAARLRGAGRLAPRMGAIAASWPFGNALALVALGTLVSLGLYRLAGILPLVAAALAMILIGLAFRRVPVPERGGHAVSGGVRAWRRALVQSAAIGPCFALYNIAFILLTSFSPQLLTADGYTPAAAATVASLPMWAFILSVPAGGLLMGGSTARGRLLVAIGCLGGGGFILASQTVADKELWYALAGLVGGVPTAPILARAAARRPDDTAPDLAYAALFLIFFVALLAFPPLVGLLIDWSGDGRVAIAVIVAMLIAAFALFCVAGAVEQRQG